MVEPGLVEATGLRLTVTLELDSTLSISTREALLLGQVGELARSSLTRCKTCGSLGPRHLLDMPWGHWNFLDEAAGQLLHMK